MKSLLQTRVMSVSLSKATFTSSQSVFFFLTLEIPTLANIGPFINMASRQKLTVNFGKSTQPPPV